MFKSIGNVVNPHLLIDAYGADALFVTFCFVKSPSARMGTLHTRPSSPATTPDWQTISNLAHRALSMTGKWLNAQVPPLGP